MPPTSAPTAYGAIEQPAPVPSTTKIEPKVWLASERTFLSWSRIGLVVSTFALALYNSAPANDWVARSMSVLYFFISIGMVLYAFAMHKRRSHRIATKFAGDHDELYGPIIICAAIFVAVLLNFILRVKQRQHLASDIPVPKNPWLLTVQQSKEAFTWFF